MRLTALLFILASCGGGGGGTGALTPQAEGALTFVAAYAELATVQQEALSAPLRFAPVNQTIDFAMPCPTSGTVAMQGTYDGDGSSDAAFLLDTTFSHCVTADSTFDGQLAWSETVSGSTTDRTFSMEMDGHINYVGPDLSGDVTYNHLVQTYTVDANSQRVSVGVSGTFTINGTTYTPTAEDWSSF